MEQTPVKTATIPHRIITVTARPEKKAAGPAHLKTKEGPAPVASISLLITPVC
jgi:hypothetical protein